MPAFHFLTELRRRHIFRVAVAYGVTAWLLLQLSAIVLPAFGAPGWVLKVLIGVFILLFPVAVLLAWAFELTPDGVRRTESEDSGEARTSPMGRRVGRTLDFLIITILAVAVGVLAWRLSEKPAGSQRTAVVSATPGATATMPARAIPEKSIAVLPFVNVSGDPKQQYFSDGLSEDLIIALSQYPALTVIGRESSFQLRNTTLDSAAIGKKLGVAHLLEGSVSRDGDEVRIRAELVDAISGHTLWSDHYDRPYKNLFALQDNITEAVASALQAKLSGSSASAAVVQSDRPRNANLEAYNAYLEGNFYYDRATAKSLRQAIAGYQHAIKLDPKYAAAYARLSRAWMQLAKTGLSAEPSLRQSYVNARAASDTALALDPQSADAHLARGYLLWTALDWHGAEAEYQRALAYAPANADAKRLLATSLASLGRLGEAVRLIREVVAVNPLDAQAYNVLSQYLSGLWQLNAAEQAVRQAIILQPDKAGIHAQLAVINLQRKDGKAALQAAREETTPVWRAWALALTYAGTGEQGRADQALQEFIAKHANDAAYQIADIYAYRKQPDEAFFWLDRAWSQRDSGITLLLYDPFLLHYKNDPRFAAFCKKVGLPVPGAARGSP